MSIYVRTTHLHRTHGSGLVQARLATPSDLGGAVGNTIISKQPQNAFISGDVMLHLLVEDFRNGCILCPGCRARLR